MFLKQRKVKVNLTGKFLKPKKSNYLQFIITNTVSANPYSICGGEISDGNADDGNDDHKVTVTDTRLKATLTLFLAFLFQNPQFNKASTYVIFAHLLRQVSSLTDGEHQFLVHWFRRLVCCFLS